MPSWRALLGAVRAKRSSLAGLTYVRRPNIGFDFGAYRDLVLRVLPSQQVKRITLINDSITPLHPRALSDINQTLEQAGAAFSGPIDQSHQPLDITSHIGSFYLSIDLGQIDRQAFTSFWQKMDYFLTKEDAFVLGEFALFQYFESQGARSFTQYGNRKIDLNSLSLEDCKAYMRYATPSWDPVLRNHLNLLNWLAETMTRGQCDQVIAKWMQIVTNHTASTYELGLAHVVINSVPIVKNYHVSKLAEIRKELQT